MKKAIFVSKGSIKVCSEVLEMPSWEYDWEQYRNYILVIGDDPRHDATFLTVKEFDSRFKWVENPFANYTQFSTIEEL